jgi:hypothetical protein
MCHENLLPRYALDDARLCCKKILRRWRPAHRLGGKNVHAVHSDLDYHTFYITVSRKPNKMPVKEGIPSKRLDRLFGHRCLMVKIEVDTVNVPLPDHYSLALIDREVALDHGRVLGYDRGHEDHHCLGGAECHRHQSGNPPTVPDDCRFGVVLPRFLNEMIQYCREIGVTIPDFLDLAALMEELSYA